MVALDKTGTLTEGKPVVTYVIGLGRAEGQILSLAAALESGSSHPLAVAVLAKAKEAKAPIPPAMAAKALPGKGMTGSLGGEAVALLSPKAAEDDYALNEATKARIDSFNAEGKTVSVLIAGGLPAGLIAIRDEPRADAAAGLAALKAAGISTVMLTDDSERTVRDRRQARHRGSCRPAARGQASDRS